MIALIAQGRPRGPGEVFYTVPWSPLIERHGELPGYAWAYLQKVRSTAARLGSLRRFPEISEKISERDILIAAVLSGNPERTAIVAFMVQLIVELGLVPSDPG